MKIERRDLKGKKIKIKAARIKLLEQINKDMKAVLKNDKGTV